MTQTAGTETEIGDDSDAPAIAGLWAVIPAGGAGTRLWPLSRSSSPKFLHDMTGAGNSLLQATWTLPLQFISPRWIGTWPSASKVGAARAFENSS